MASPIEATLTMFPRVFWPSITWTALRMANMGPLTLTAKTWSQRSSEMSPMASKPSMMPALLTRTSSLPHFSTAKSIMPSLTSRLQTSPT